MMEKMMMPNTTINMMGTMKLNISNIANIFQPSFNVPIFNQTIYVLPT